MRLVEYYARFSPRLAHRTGSSLASRAHAWILSRSRGRIGKTLFGSPLLVLRTTGRKSGQPRESPVVFVEHGDGYAVVASNGASPRPPAWWLNLQAHPDCQAFVAGRRRALHAREATDDEAAGLSWAASAQPKRWRGSRALTNLQGPGSARPPRRACPPPALGRDAPGCSGGTSAARRPVLAKRALSGGPFDFRCHPEGGSDHRATGFTPISSAISSHFQ